MENLSIVDDSIWNPDHDWILLFDKILNPENSHSTKKGNKNRKLISFILKWLGILSTNNPDLKHFFLCFLLLSSFDSVLVDIPCITYFLMFDFLVFAIFKWFLPGMFDFLLILYRFRHLKNKLSKMRIFIIKWSKFEIFDWPYSLLNEDIWF
jgi:hypothetical protein